MVQCVLLSTVRDEEKQVAVATKVAMQMNCKLGGEPWMIKQQAKKTIIIGIDTYHDTGIRHRLKLWDLFFFFQIVRVRI